MPRNNRGGNRSGRNNNPSGRNQYSGGVMDLARERPVAAAAVAAGAAAAGLFLWSKRSQISDQISSLSDQFGDWTENMRAERGDDEWTLVAHPKAPCVQFEHTVVATRRGALVVTLN